MTVRLVYRRRHGFNTASNKVKKVKTPGGRLVFYHLKRTSKAAACGDCHTRLSGLKRLTGAERHRTAKSQKTVNRAYGGSRCASCVRGRIVRAFLIEEQKIVKRFLKQQQNQPKSTKA
eukprot:TRINITY_DN4578_c0_g1_i1.p1 TRINITY_DN4578_c0_g1~~TRINITY_DN4578_c0_g1_i1.p1  ORF type:complete len:118 (+),score=27.93 TRINITY_DN4578_c0_g1_i1:47-400(+)